MAKVHIKRPDGTRIVIEGNPQEVAALVSRIEGGRPSKGKGLNLLQKRRKRERLTLSDSLLLLMDEGFFKKPKDLTAVKTALAGRGHVYPVTTISPALLRLVQRRYLRRIKQDKRWFYTG